MKQHNRTAKSKDPKESSLAEKQTIRILSHTAHK